MKIAFLGLGNMAGAVILANGGKNLNFEDIILFDICKDKCERFARLGSVCAESVREAVELSDCVFLSVKPQDYFTLLDEVKTADGYKDKLYISIGAGIQSETVERYLNCGKVVRALPNTPMLIGKGVSAVCKNEKIDAGDFAFAYSLFESAGSAFLIEEQEMNRIIGVTSSSPAYVFKFIQSMLDGASAQGHDTDGMLSVVCDVVIGAAELLKTSGKTSEEMISMVASKGGTTERALAALDENDFSLALIKAMKACSERAEELGKIK
ncbi:MAG: pyrroline-5-carboxylate reductase [Clostridia bacterium]|nr:pyrroline-5-carboxylate reductase [Clostridia bacterium]